ncbi:MAG: ABC transporter substrate-binding protein [Acidimicrobiales bacterium]
MSTNYPSPTAWDGFVERRSVLKGGAAAGALVVGGSVLAACGDDSFTGEIGSASGTLNVGSNASDPNPQAGLQAVVDSFPNKDVDVTINTLDHNTYQENITTILQAQDDDVLAWFAGFRNKFFADQGLVGDISDVWENITGLGEGFKAASTASDGNQYFVPTNFYTWAVNYSKNTFGSNGYSEPQNLDELMALAEQMMSDGITPFAAANDGKWPLMGTFDALNLRINGYDYHVDLMGGNESWTDDRTRAVFDTWTELLPFHQEGANGRTWQEAAIDLEEGRTGMFLLGTFAASASDGLAADMDFFNFPEIDPAIGAAALDAPIDGFQLVAEPTNEAAAKELLLHMSTPVAQDAYLSQDPSVVASNSGANTSVYNDLQKKSSELASAATGISQFLDRDTIPDFAGAAGDMFAEFIENPGNVDSLLGDLEEKKVAIFADFNS